MSGDVQVFGGPIVGDGVHVTPDENLGVVHTRLKGVEEDGNVHYTIRKAFHFPGPHLQTATHDGTTQGRMGEMGGKDERKYETE